MNLDIAQVLEGLASRQPTAPALHVTGRTSLTYADLGAQIRYVRERLGSWGIVPGDVIAGVIPTRPEMAVACATIPAAATFAPLSPALTRDNYTKLLTRLRPKALVVPRGLDHPVRAIARQCGVAEIDLTADPRAPAGMFTFDMARSDRSLQGVPHLPPDIAYIASTTGTSGWQKLVPIRHNRMILRARVDGDWRRMTPTDVGCHLIPMHLSHGLQGALVIPLLRGSSVVCLPESDISGFFAALDEYRLTWLTAGFTVHRAILERGAAHREVLARSSLRLLRAGSGLLEPAEIERIEQVFRAPLLVTFGTTESGEITSSPMPPRARKRGSVGLPVCSEVALVNQAGGVCLAGEAGEIVVRGPLVFDGYLGDPQATAAAFGDGWFRTGDLGRFDEDGYLFLKGRVKDIINRGGEKISPVEIDTAIETLAGVRAAASFGIPHRTLGEEVIAAVVKDGTAAIEEFDIIDRVRQQMGPLRAPRRIYFVDQLPRTDSGKLRRSELPRLLGLDQPEVAGQNESPVEPPAPEFSPLEAALAGLWSTVLQVKDVAVHDDFFLLGGDSLRGARLLTSVKAVFGIEISIQALFGNAATVAGMAWAIGAARGADDTKPATTMEKRL